MLQGSRLHVGANVDDLSILSDQRNHLDEDLEYNEDSDEEESETNYVGDKYDTKEGYLLRYEQIIRQQDAEEMALVAHLRPLFERLRVLGAEPSPRNSSTRLRSRDNRSTGLKSIGSGSSRSSLSYSYHSLRDNGQRVVKQEEDLEFLSFRAMKRSLRVLDDATNTSADIMRTDQQFIMVVRELVSASYSAAPSKRNSTGSNMGQILVKGLSFPEFLQCYKVVIGGMQTLKMLPQSDASPRTTARRSDLYDEDNEHLIHHLRETATKRVLTMLKTFGEHDVSKKEEVNKKPVERRKSNSKKEHAMGKLKDDHVREMNELLRYNKILCASLSVCLLTLLSARLWKAK